LSLNWSIFGIKKAEYFAEKAENVEKPTEHFWP
jgi:hypothetical protein